MKSNVVSVEHNSVVPEAERSPYSYIIVMYVCTQMGVDKRVPTIISVSPKRCTFRLYPSLLTHIQ